MSQSPHDHTHMEDLVALAGQVEPPGLPALGHPTQIKHGTNQIRQRHHTFIGHYHIAVGITPVHHSSMHCRNNPEQPHWHEQQNAEGTALPRREGRGEQRDDGAGPHYGYACEVHHLPMWGALEDVVHCREEGGDDHHRDPDVV